MAVPRQYLDEVSMIASNQFLQCDVRMRQAKQNPSRKFGGLAINVCGDFLQLPPVDKDGSRKSLAVPINATGKCLDNDETPQKGDEDAKAEARQGYELWRSFTRVVCLTVNLCLLYTDNAPKQKLRHSKHCFFMLWFCWIVVLSFCFCVCLCFVAFD